MGLVEYHLDLTSSTPLPVMGGTQQETVDLVEEYKDMFSGLGKLRGVKVKLHVDPDTKGAVPCRNTEEYLYRSKTYLMGFLTSGRKCTS